MKIWFFLALSLIAGRMGVATPLQLHNRIVFTREDAAKQNEMVWTMNLDGSDPKRFWRVPEGYGQFGCFSGDGTKALSFNQFNLYVHDLQTKRARRVLVWGGGIGTYIRRPSFSLDGKQILCEVGDSSQNATDSYVLLLQTEKFYPATNDLNAQKLHPIGETIPSNNLWSEPRWSADGQRIVAVGGPRYSFNDYYSRPQKPIAPDIWMMNVDGTDARQITKSSSWEEAPAWSPNGREIVFVRRVDIGQSDIGGYATNVWSADLVSGAETQLTFLPETYETRLAQNEDANVSTPLFSPDGKQIAFQESGSRGGGIYRMDTDGKNQKRLGTGTLIQWMP